MTLPTETHFILSAAAIILLSIFILVGLAMNCDAKNGWSGLEPSDSSWIKKGIAIIVVLIVMIASTMPSMKDVDEEFKENIQKNRLSKESELDILMLKVKALEKDIKDLKDDE